MPTENAIDAINEALGLTGSEADATAGDDTEAELEDGAVTGDEGALSDGGADDGEGGEQPEGEEGAGEEGEEGGRARGPDGRFLKQDGTPEGQQPPKDGQQPGAKKDGQQPPKDGQQPGAKKPDPLNDPIPKELKQETQDRIRTLITMNRETTQKFEAIQRDFDFMVSGLQQAGVSPEQYGETLSWLALFNSNDPKQQEKALELVESVADRLATLLGKERTVNDPLAQHADLQEAVRTNKITAQYAKEIARTRNSQSFRTELSTVAQNAQTQQQQQAQALQQARSDLNTLETELKARDPLYEQKKAQIVPILKPLFKHLPPAQWKGAFEEAYKNARVASAARKSGSNSPPANQPMRAKGGSGAGGGSMARQPSNALEAMNAALSSMKG